MKNIKLILSKVCKPDFQRLIFLLLLVAAMGVGRPTQAGFEVAPRIGYFDPVDNFVQSFYKAGLIYGIYGGWLSDSGLGAAVGADFYIHTVDYNSKINSFYLIPVTASAIWRPWPRERVSPLFGFGFGWYHLTDRSHFLAETNSHDGFGYHGLAGLRVGIYEGLFTDLQLKYSYARLDSLSKVDIGGWTSTLGVGYAF